MVIHVLQPQAAHRRLEPAKRNYIVDASKIAERFEIPPASPYAILAYILYQDPPCLEAWCKALENNEHLECDPE
jgi:hypothetical protein